MKLLNYTTSYFAVVLLIIISVWSGLFYYAMLEEIYDSIDDGLDNQKGLIIQKAAVDTSILYKAGFDEGDYAVKEISLQSAIHFHDEYVDTSMYMQNENDFEPVRLLRTVFHQNNKYYQLQVVTSMVEEDDLTKQLLYSVLWLYFGLVATILLLNNFLLKRIWKPFYHLLKQLKHFRLERSTTVDIKRSKIDEFTILNESILKLLESNINAYNSQKHFIENASHELQTPLAISINKLESVAESASLTEDEMKKLGSAMDYLERLTRLNRSLLLLSRIENKQYGTKENININEIVKRIAEDFSDQLNYSNIAMNIEEAEIISVNMNSDLATIMITNLIKNAIVHNHSFGFINIIIKNDSLIIENTGLESALKEKLLFARFNKQEQSTTSHGLGLSIVKAIADHYKFSISYSYDNKHIMRLQFN